MPDTTLTRALVALSLVIGIPACSGERASDTARRAPVAESRTVKVFPGRSSEPPPMIGWSWFVRTTPEGVPTVGHTGSQGGFRSAYVVVSDHDIFFVILCNAPRGVKDMTKEIHAWLQRR